MTPQFKDGPEVRQFMEEHVGDRPTTVGLLQVAFKLWQEQQQEGRHSQLLEESREPSVEEQNLDNLSIDSRSKSCECAEPISAR